MRLFNGNFPNLPSTSDFNRLIQFAVFSRQIFLLASVSLAAPVLAQQPAAQQPPVKVK